MRKTDRQPVILIVTYSEDNECVARVMAAVAVRGGNAHRFDTDLFPTALQLASHCSDAGERAILVCGDETIDLRTVSAVWYRRVAIGQRIPAAMDPQLRRSAIEESKATVYGLIATMEAFHLDHVHRVRRAEHKPLQLQIARQVGLRVPRTLITNDPAVVRAFAQECTDGMVMKTLTSFSIDVGTGEQAVFTNRIGPEDLEHLDELRYCPSVFQEELPKARELRCTIVGDRVFTAAIDSQRSERARVDWRRDGIGLIDRWEPYGLPAEVEQRLLALMRRLGLNYGAADLIVTPQGEHVFLEVNPNGEFYWLDRHLGLPLTDEIADLLVADRPDRR